jgi:tetratricopeptide (TPR) repeat protein
LNKESTSFLYETAQVLLNKDGLSKEAYQLAADNFRSLPSAHSFIFDRLALALQKAGKLNEAIGAQEKAVQLAKMEIVDPKRGSRILEQTIVSYEEKLKQLKSKN